MGKKNQVGTISKNNLSVFNLCKYKAGATTARTVAWLVDCGMPDKFAINRVIATEKRMIETMVKENNSAPKSSFPMVVAVAFPAIMAPKKTVIPNRPGIKLFLITLEP